MKVMVPMACAEASYFLGNVVILGFFFFSVLGAFFVRLILGIFKAFFIVELSSLPIL